MFLTVSGISNSSDSYKVLFKSKMPSEKAVNAAKKVKNGDKLNNAMGLIGWAFLVSALIGSVIYGIKALLVERHQKQEHNEIIDNRTKDVISSINYDDAIEMMKNQ